MPYVTGLMAGHPVARSSPPPITCACSRSRFVPSCRRAVPTRCSAPTVSDVPTRRVKLREFFEVNRYYIVVAALKSLADEGAL